MKNASKFTTSTPNQNSLDDGFETLDWLDSLNESDMDGLMKLSESVTEITKSERENALIVQQADCIKKQHPIRPQFGWLKMQKSTNKEKALALSDLGTPKKYQHDELERFGVHPNVIDLNIDNVLKFKFDMWKFFPSELCQTNIDGIVMKDEMKVILDGNGRVELKEITSAFLQCPSVDPKLVPDHWINNGFKFILLKLTGYERSFPHKFAAKCLTPENVSVLYCNQHG